MTTAAPRHRLVGPEADYKWIALSNTTLGIFLPMLNTSSLTVALAAVFRGIHLNPLAPANVDALLWVLTGFMLVTAVSVVTFGRLGDIFGRVRMYNLGFLIFTVGAVLLSLTWSTGTAGAYEIVVFRMVQAVGAALLMANSAAILTDAFPPDQRGMAMGINQMAGFTGSFVGLVAGGILASLDWRLVFLVNVPLGLFGTVWAYLRLREVGERHAAPIDWLGNASFTVGLALLLIGISYGVLPYGGASMGWGNPFVLATTAGGLLMLALFVGIEVRVRHPMFAMELFRLRPFATGSLAGFLYAVVQGGLQFLLIIWLQGVWLPLHGYSYAVTPLWAGIYMIPLTVGVIVGAPLSGLLADRYGARPLATLGMALAALAFFALMRLPVVFPYPAFAAALLVMGFAFGLFAAPNVMGIMNSVPSRHRGAASGMRATMQNTGMPLSVGVFFSLMVLGMAGAMPLTLMRRLTAVGVPAALAGRLAHIPAVSYLFAAFLGFDPLRSLMGPAYAHLAPAASRAIARPSFFPRLIAGPFHDGVLLVMLFSVAVSAAAAVVSWLRGGRFVYEEAEAGQEARAGAPEGALTRRRHVP